MNKEEKQIELIIENCAYKILDSWFVITPKSKQKPYGDIWGMITRQIEPYFKKALNQKNEEVKKLEKENIELKQAMIILKKTIGKKELGGTNERR